MSLIKNFSFAFGAQSLILIISVLRALILPKYLSVETFGYWEIYMFYTSYVGILCLGYTDGIYLRYGEYNYNQLPLKIIRSGNRVFIGMLSAFTILSIFVICFFVDNENVKFALFYSALNILILGVTTMYIYVFQITNMFKKYSIFSVLDKLLVFLTIIILLVSNEWNYKYLINVDLFAKFLVLLLLIKNTPELIFGQIEKFKTSYCHLTQNITVGIKLMIANLMSMLLIGTGRFIVQYYGDIADFAVYSFGISLTGLVLVAVTSFGLVLYPAVKRVDQEHYPELFDKINSFNRLLGLTSILLYFPVFLFVKYYYSQYGSVLVYLNILFVLIFMQCKIGMLNNTFYKALREERNLLWANLSCVFLFLILALMGFFLIPEMWVIAACTLVAMSYRCYSSEVFLCRKLSICFNKRNYIEIGVMIVFLASTAMMPFKYAFIIVTVSYLVWFIINYRLNKRLILGILGKSRNFKD